MSAETNGHYWQEFRRLHGRILGALLDDVAGVLANLAAVREIPGELPRMADYALILFALDEHTGVDFTPAYIASVRGVMADRAKADPLTAALLAQARRHDGSWKGTASALLAAIETSTGRTTSRALADLAGLSGSRDPQESRDAPRGGARSRVRRQVEQGPYG